MELRIRTLVWLSATLLLLAACEQSTPPPEARKGSDVQDAGRPRPVPPDDAKSSPAPTAEPAVVVGAPILLVPGILGSWTKQRDLIYERIDIPDLKEWDLSERVRGVAWAVFPHLIQRLNAKGLIFEKDVFAVPYDWRRPLGDHRPLKDWIDQAKSQFRLTRGRTADKVDIVAYSYGGLVVRSYIQSDEFRGDIASVAIVASPHFGAPDSYYTWAGGLIPSNRDKVFIWHIGNQLKAMNKGIDYRSNRPLVEFVRSYVRSLRDLLPAAVEDPTKEAYLFGWPEPGATALQAMKQINRNPTLEALNRSLSVLTSRVRLQVFVAQGNQRTLETIRVRAPTTTGSWEDGEPDEAKLTNGDGTVPFSPALARLFPTMVIGSADHQDAVCAFTPDLLKFLQIPVSHTDQCALTRLRPKSSLSFGVMTRTLASFAVRTPAGQALWPMKEGDLNWVSDRLRYLIIPDPPDGLYGVSVEGQAGDHYFFGGYAGDAMIPERFQYPIQLMASAVRRFEVELRNSRLTLKELP